MTEVKRPRPVVLCILDGWGFRPDAEDNAVTRAKAPHFRAAWDRWPHALLEASGEDVGLPAGQIGNSEVGHMNMGAGRVIFQDLPMIDRAIAQDGLMGNTALQTFAAKLQQSDGTCHLLGLASPGGVHAHQRHMVALAKVLTTAGVKVAVHAFLDGRDVAPQSAAGQIALLQGELPPGAALATLCGRYYAMDRDNRWDRVRLAYDLVTGGAGAAATDAVTAIKAGYAAGVNDEFLPPVALNGFAGMHDGDGVLFANFRTDRAREILAALLDPQFDAFPRGKVVNFAASAGMVEYSDHLNTLMPALFPPKVITQTLGELVAGAGRTQLRIAETEKYPHVTFFFNGGRETPYAGEERIVVPSPKVATYDLQPEMSAYTITDKIVAAIDSARFDFIVLNFANSDMVGHSGIFAAAVKAVEAIDVCLGRLFAVVERQGGCVFVTADHGNCETMFDPMTHGPHTAHTLEKVPAILVGAPASVKTLRDGRLADVAPTLLQLMDMPQPPVMDGKSLLG